MCSRRILTLVGTVAVSLLVAGNAFAALSGAEQKCIDGYNNFLRLVSAQAGKSATACIKNASKGAEMNPESCIVTNTDGKIAGKEAKVSALYPAKCNGSEPIQQGAAAGNLAHRNSATNLAHDMFGSPIGAISTDKGDAKCLQKSIQRATQAFTEIIKAHRACKKNGMKGGAVIDSATLDTACGTFAAIDAGGKANAKLNKLNDDVVASCAATTTPLSGLFDGLAGSCHASAAALGGCLKARTRCQACFTLNDADGQSINCDVFDDGATNGSCFIPINVGSHTCTLLGGVGNSALNLGTQALPLNLVPSGSVSINCGSTDGAGKAACSLNVISFAPIVIPSIGDVCVNPASCPSGEVDCDGGNAEDVDLVADHNIGNCANDTACGTACNAYCGGLGAAYSRISYGCEGFCQGGPNNDLACTDDSQCPTGSCTGANPPVHVGKCNCACQGEGLGSPAPAGSLAAPIGTQIDVELPSDGDCLDANTISLAPICGAVTTTTAKGQIKNANNTAMKTIPPIGGMGTAPDVQTGAPLDCNAASGSTVTGLKMVGHLGFPDTTLGDIFSTNIFVCQ
ncbi:MAG: hypothetical protein U0802_10095 [Candidatus Binatia bacterium]